MLKKMQEWFDKLIYVKDIDMEPKIEKMSPPKIEGMPVQITDIDMPFGSMIMFMVKWALAAIPAIIIFWVVVGSIPVIIGAFFTQI